MNEGSPSTRWVETLHEARLIRRRLLKGLQKAERAVSPKEFQSSVVTVFGSVANTA
ncbi:hypothetical protein [Rhizobium leguminosarum]|uniref:hypothetical protein n=1 Tax=Rhizobium leguminosarum TaxID=384 RepID=UPI0004BB8511|nr:hypothetical protein [Rhizobium leguminosarum]